MAHQDLAFKNREVELLFELAFATDRNRPGRLRDDFPVANSTLRLWLFAASTYAFCNSASKHGVHSPPVSPPSPCRK